MKKICGTIGSFLAAMAAFRLTYGAWPPFEGTLGEWLASDPRARWALLAGIVGVIVGGIIGQIIGGLLEKDK